LKKNKIIIILIILVLLIIIGSVIGIIYVTRPSETNRVVITSDNKIVKTIDLSTEKNQTFDIEYNGNINTVEIKDGKIRVLEADCPDKICVDTGWLKSDSLPIVCLPNKLVIKFESSSDDIDSVAK
jgi:hypothetical protein